MAKITKSNALYATVFMVAGAGLTLASQEALKVLNPEQSGEVLSQTVDYLTQPAPRASLAFAGSTEAKQAQEDSALEQRHLEEKQRLIKAGNEAVFAAQIKPLLDVITAIPASGRGEQFVVKSLNTAKSAKYEVGYTSVFVVNEPMTSLRPIVTQISHDPDTNTYVYHEVQSGLKQRPFVISVGEDGFSIETSNGFTMDKQNYGTIEEMYAAIGEEIRILAPKRLGELSLLEQGGQPSAAASATPTPAPTFGM